MLRYINCSSNRHNNPLKFKQQQSITPKRQGDQWMRVRFQSPTVICNCLFARYNHARKKKLIINDAVHTLNEINGLFNAMIFKSNKTSTRFILSHRTRKGNNLSALVTADKRTIVVITDVIGQVSGFVALGL